MTTKGEKASKGKNANKGERARKQSEDKMSTLSVEVRRVVAAGIVLTSFIAALLKVSEWANGFDRPVQVESADAEVHFVVRFVTFDGRPATDLIVDTRGVRRVPNKGGYLNLPLAVLEQPLDVFFDGLHGRVLRAMPGLIELPSAESHRTRRPTNDRAPLPTLILDVLPLSTDVRRGRESPIKEIIYRSGIRDPGQKGY